MDINSVFSDINQKLDIRNKNRVTHFFIITAATIFADINWSVLKAVFDGEKNWPWLLYGCFLFLLLLSLSWLMDEGSKLYVVVNFIVVLVSYFSFFHFTKEMIIIIVVVFILFITGYLRAHQELTGRINIKCMKIFKAGLPLVITGLAIMMASAFYHTPAVYQCDNVTIPRPLYDTIIRPLIVEITESNASNLGGELTDQEVQTIIALEPELIEKYNINISDTPTQSELEDAIYLVLNRQINDVIKPIQQYLPLLLAIGFFLFIKSIGHFLMYLVAFIGWLIFRILVSLGAIRINVEPTVKEVIEI